MAVIAAGFRMGSHEEQGGDAMRGSAVGSLALPMSMIKAAEQRNLQRPALSKVSSVHGLQGLETAAARNPGGKLPHVLSGPIHPPNGHAGPHPQAQQASPLVNSRRVPESSSVQAVTPPLAGQPAPKPEPRRVHIPSLHSVPSQNGNGTRRSSGSDAAENDEYQEPPPPAKFDAPIAMSREEMERLGIRTDTLSESQLNLRLKTQGDRQFLWSVLSLIIMVIQKEISFNNNAPSIATDAMRAAISLLSILLAFHVIAYYRIRVQILIRKNLAAPGSSVFTAGLGLRMLFELGQCLIHNCPYIDRTSPVLENIVVMIMFLRLRYCFRFMVMHSKLFTPSGRFIGVLTQVHFSDSFVVRTILFNRPWAFMAAAYGIMLSVTSYSMYQFERQHAVDTGTEEDHPLILYRNNIWCAIITSLTVGYGDMYPKTDLGRLVVLVAAVCGAFLTALSIALIHNQLELNVQQTKVVQFLKKDEYKTRVKLAAVRCIQAGWRVHLAYRRKASRWAARAAELRLFRRLNAWRALKQSYQFQSVGLDATYHHQVTVIEAIFTCVRDLISRLEENGILENTDFPFISPQADEGAMTARRLSSTEPPELDGRDSPTRRVSVAHGNDLLEAKAPSVSATPRLGPMPGAATSRMFGLPAPPVPLRAAIGKLEGQVGDLTERLDGVVRLLEKSTGLSLAEVAPPRPAAAVAKPSKSMKFPAGGRPKSRAAPHRPSVDTDGATTAAAAAAAAAAVGMAHGPPGIGGIASPAPPAAEVAGLFERLQPSLPPMSLGSAVLPPTSERVAARTLSGDGAGPSERQKELELAQVSPASEMAPASIHRGSPHATVREDICLTPDLDADAVRPAALPPSSVSSLAGPSSDPAARARAAFADMNPPSASPPNLVLSPTSARPPVEPA